MTRSNSVPSPKWLTLMISRLSSKTVIPVPSNVIRVGSLEDLNLNSTQEDMMGEESNEIYWW